MLVIIINQLITRNNNSYSSINLGESNTTQDTQTEENTSENNTTQNQSVETN